MTEFESVFIDTAPFIYFIEKSDLYFDTMKRFFENCYGKGTRLATSAITMEEYCVYPLKNGNAKSVQNFRAFLADMEIPVLSVDSEIAYLAATLRAKYLAIKAMDALQLASAICSDCDVFLTNDKQLRQVEEIQVSLVDDL